MKRNLMVLLPCLALLVLTMRAVESAPVLGKPIKPRHDFVTTTTWTVEPESGQPTIRGRVSVACFADDRDEFKIELQGLKPNAVYSVWLSTSLKDTAVRGGIGKAPYTRKSTGGGSMTVECPLEKCPLTEWKWLEVRYHADGDASHVQQSTRVAKVRLLAQ